MSESLTPNGNTLGSWACKWDFAPFLGHVFVVCNFSDLKVGVEDSIQFTLTLLAVPQFNDYPAEFGAKNRRSIDVEPSKACLFVCPFV